VFRINVGMFETKEGGMISTGVPKGFTDLFGHRKSDGRAFYIECKNETGRVKPHQVRFIEAMRKAGALTGVARSVEEAIKIVEGDK